LGLGTKHRQDPFRGSFPRRSSRWTISHFFAGAFLCNCVSHLACGLRGEAFPTPFANPRGKGPSAPVVNFLWGAFNLLVGVYLLSRHPVTVDFEPGFLALVLGALAIGIYLSLHFGEVRRDRSSGS
jgi:hypothetical protein